MKAALSFVGPPTHAFRLIWKLLACLGFSRILIFCEFSELTLDGRQVVFQYPYRGQ